MTGASAALPVWTEFMKSAVALRPELGGRTFECPEGIKFVETDADTGFLSTLACPHRELVAITDRLAPNFECYSHGNAPTRLPGIDVSETPDEGVTVAQNARARATKILPQNHFSNTVTDSDANGRRILINSMR
jgi:membrane carboxypeptidase/penicillin-binding protein